MYEQFTANQFQAMSKNIKFLYIYYRDHKTVFEKMTHVPYNSGPVQLVASKLPAKVASYDHKALQ